MSAGRLGRSPGIGRAGGSVGHGPPHLLEQRERAPGARRVRPVREQHDEQIAIGIDPERDRKSTRLNSSHGSISYAVFCLKKKIEIGIEKNFDIFRKGIDKLSTDYMIT